MDIHESARRHGVADEAIQHALTNAITILDLDPHSDPPKVLVVGPDRAGNLLEVIWLELVERELVIRAMPLRPAFYDLLPGERDSS